MPYCDSDEAICGVVPWAKRNAVIIDATASALVR
jgi:hypothetical protein